MNKIVLSAALFFVPVVFAAQADNRAIFAAPQFIVRTDTGRQTDTIAFNQLKDLVNKGIESANTSIQDKALLKVKLAVLIYMNDQIYDCLAKDIRALLGKPDTPDLVTVIKQSLLAGKKDYITDETVNNITKPAEYEAVKKYGIDVEKLKSVIKELVLCVYFVDLLVKTKKSTMTFGIIYKPRVYIAPKYMSRINNYLKNIESTLVILFSSRPVAKKREAIEQSVAELGKIDFGDPEAKKFMLDKYNEVVQKTLAEQEEAAKTLVLPSATEPSATVSVPGAAAKPEEVWSLAIALSSIPA